MTTPRSRSKPVDGGGSAMGAGGQRLAEAFDAVSALPALAEARRRLLRVCEAQSPSAGDVTQVVESDAALAIAIMRAANNGDGPAGRVTGVREAVESLTPAGVRDVVTDMETYDVRDVVTDMETYHMPGRVSTS